MPIRRQRFDPLIVPPNAFYRNAKLSILIFKNYGQSALRTYIATMICSIAHRSHAAALMNELKSVLRRLHSYLIISSKCSLTRNERMGLGFNLFDRSEASAIP